LGAIWFQAIDFANAMSELIGHKSGLALSRQDLIEHVQDEDDWADLFRLSDDETIRIRSEAVEALVAHLLYRVGNIETPDIRPAMIKMYHRFKKDKNNLARFQSVIEDFNPLLQEEVDRTPQDAKLLDPTDLLTTIARKHGKFGIDVASEMLIGINQEFHLSPWTLMRTVEWEDERELRDLFVSENLATNYGIFFDQRFIDYLQANFDKIDVMNWRQFEGLAAEHLVRQGFSIDLGPGRNDDGVDIRVFPAEAREGLPPTTAVRSISE